MILVIDNYDSFVHNLARYIRQLGCKTEVVRNDGITIAEIRAAQPSAIVISPGPCSPNEAGLSLEVIEAFKTTTPMLGVCLGHQAIVQAFGGRVVVSHQPMHGRESEIVHWGSPMFQNIPSPFKAGRYHSLIAERESIPAELEVTARTDDFTIMAVEHRTLPIVGLQFHPESILTVPGYAILQNFFRLAGLETISPTSEVAHVGQTRIDVSDPSAQTANPPT